MVNKKIQENKKMKTKRIVAIGIASLGLCASAMAEGAQELKKKALLYLPMEKDKIMELPTTGASAAMLGDKPVFSVGKKGDALVVDGEGVSVKGIKIKGASLINGKQGTVAFWMKPLVSYTEGKGRHYFLTAKKTNGLYIYIMSPNAGFYSQTVNDKKWISPHFNFKWWKKPQWSAKTWYHIAVTWGPGKETIFYVNGALVYKAKECSSIELAADTILVGCSGDGKSSADALLDEFYIFGDILGKEDVVSLMNDK